MNNKNSSTNLNNAGGMGFTLVEVVVALFILIISLTALLILFSRTRYGAEAARCHLNALQVARTELEQFSTDYSSITSYAATNLTDAFFTARDGKKQCSAPETNGYKDITLIISWQSPGRAQVVSQTFNTIICSTN